jgi:hypothetical protein
MALTIPAKEQACHGIIPAAILLSCAENPNILTGLLFEHCIFHFSR